MIATPAHRRTTSLALATVLAAGLVFAGACGKLAEVGQKVQEARKATSSRAPEPPPVNFFEGDHAAKAVAQLAERLGAPVKALEIVIYPDSVSFQVQDPKKAENVDEFRVRGSELDGPRPVRLIGGGNLEENLYSTADVRFDLIPQLVKTAAEQIELEGEEVTHVIVKRNLPFSQGVRIRVFVNGTRKSGNLDADAKGKIVEIDKG